MLLVCKPNVISAIVNLYRPDIREIHRILSRAMKDMGVDDWLINTMSQLFDLYRKGYASQVYPAVEEVIGRNPKSFSQFAKDYSQAFN